MKVYRGYQQYTGGSQRPVIAIGNFDGVHLGHQRVIQTARDEAKARGGELFVFTFDPHPAKILAPQKAPPLLTSLNGKLRQLSLLGVEQVIVQPFDTEFAQISATAFVEHILIQSLSASAVVVGYDFTFGQKRAGTFELLKSIAASHGVGAIKVEAFDVNGVVASSSKIRAFLLEGKPQEAARLLGRPFSLTGTVVHGQARGRTIGVPTANVQPEEELLPASGVYACLVTVQGDEKTYLAATNVGAAPTFQNKTVTIEAHLLDTAQDLYGKTLTVSFIERIREQQRFSGIDELQKQIARDIEVARTILKEERRT